MIRCRISSVGCVRNQQQDSTLVLSLVRAASLFLVVHATTTQSSRSARTTIVVLWTKRTGQLAKHADYGSVWLLACPNLDHGTEGAPTGSRSTASCSRRNRLNLKRVVHQPQHRQEVVERRHAKHRHMLSQKKSHFTYSHHVMRADPSQCQPVRCRVQIIPFHRRGLLNYLHQRSASSRPTPCPCSAPPCWHNRTSGRLCSYRRRPPRRCYPCSTLARTTTCQRCAISTRSPSI